MFVYCAGADLHSLVNNNMMFCPSLTWPDLLRTGAYRLDIISAVLKRSGTVHSIKKFRYTQILGSVNWFM